MNNNTENRLLWIEATLELLAKEHGINQWDVKKKYDEIRDTIKEESLDSDSDAEQTKKVM